MNKKIEIKEEEQLVDNQASQNEREFFHDVVSVNTNIVTVLVDTDCDMTVKTEVKSETLFIKTETATCSNNWEMHRETEIEHQTPFPDFGSQNEGEFLLEDPLQLDNKYNSDHEIHNKIEIKEELWSLETETSSICDNIKDEDFPPEESSRLLPETVAGATNDKPPLLLADAPAIETSFCNGIDHHKYKKCGVICGVLTPNEYVHSDQYGKYTDEADRYIQLLNLKNRSLNNLVKRPQLCHICGKSFSHLSHLKAHIHIHEGKKPHQCKICKKSFTQSSNLKRHNLVHEGKKPHQCKVCKRNFTELSHLKTHSLIHEGKKPHHCKVCNKSFTQLTQLKRHSLDHESRRPHQCRVCNKSFALLSDLKRHNLVHDYKKPHQCQVCNKSFTLLSDLKRHNLVHEAKKEHQCVDK